FSSKLCETLRNSIAGILLACFAIAICPAFASSGPNNFDRAVRTRGHCSSRAAQQESFDSVSQTGSANEDAVGPPFFGDLDQKLLRITFKYVSRRPQTRSL